MTTSALDPTHTALVLIDLQHGIVSRQTAPHAAADVVAHATTLARRFRDLGAPVVLVRVAYAANGADRLAQPVDDTGWARTQLPPDWSEIVPELGPEPSDLVITKHQWGAFYGTELELQLRRRGVNTIVVGGISTNFGVESTARDAYERGFALVFVEDAMAGLSAEAHAFAVGTIFPRIGRVRRTDDILELLDKRRTTR
jgi:nicotinamidase-related amidase